MTRKSVVTSNERGARFDVDSWRTVGKRDAQEKKNMLRMVKERDTAVAAVTAAAPDGRHELKKTQRVDDATHEQ